jgi:uridine kinase
MKGDILIINEDHRKAGAQAAEIMIPEIESEQGCFMISVGGESGAGKSEIAASVADFLEEKGIKSYIFQQDDYFVYPPKTNAEMRKKDISHVGLSEVKLKLIDNQLEQILKGAKSIKKPLVIFDEDRIDEEVVDVKDYQVFIVEGTYTLTLKNIDCHIFIDRNYRDTLEARKKRNREKQDAFLEKILKIEHEIITELVSNADIIITKDFNAIKVEK